MSFSLPDVTFVVTKSGHSSLFERNFAASPVIKGVAADRIIVQEGFSSAAIAYNDAIDRAKTDLIVFAHQDVYFPDDWLANLEHSLQLLKLSDPDWGVLGCAGANNRGLFAAHLYSVGLGMVGAPFERPVPIDTLDEFVLILRKSSGLRFDPTLPHFHFYGTDICMSARKDNRKCYVISAFSVHNTSYGTLSPEFFRCYWHIKARWAEYLPIQTTCIRISRWNTDFITHHLKQTCFSLLGREIRPLPRLHDPRAVLGHLADGQKNSERLTLATEPWKT